MKKVCGVIILSAVLMTASGCFLPVKITYSEPIQGRIIDQKTSLVISNAKIHLSATYGRGNMDVTTSSDKKGEFYIKKQSDVVWVFFMGDPVVKPLRFKVEADGYKAIDSYLYEESRNLYVESEHGSASETEPWRIRIELEPIDPNALPANPG